MNNRLFSSLEQQMNGEGEVFIPLEEFGEEQSENEAEEICVRKGS